MNRVTDLVSQRPVVIFSKTSCCMCHTIKSLFTDIGVNAAIYELDEDPRGRETERVLSRLAQNRPAVPAVFIGGVLAGGANEVMSLHLRGLLIPWLRRVGAIWV